MKIEEEFQAAVQRRNSSSDEVDFLNSQSEECLKVLRACGVKVVQSTPGEIQVQCPNKASLRSVKSEGLISCGYSVTYWVLGS